MRLGPSQRSLVTRAYLRYLASTRGPIVLGPYRSELGFEVLYWLPFLKWALKAYGISPDRCVALSRGGMGAFYGVAHVVDLYELKTVDEVRLENQVDAEARGLMKQTGVTTWDREIARAAVEKAGLKGGPHLLHPAWMYWLFEDFWGDRAGVVPLLSSHTDYTPLPTVNLPEGFTLPKAFVAVRFYDRHTFPLHEETRRLVTEVVHGLAETIPVVILNQATCFDDHVDLPLSGPNVYALPTVKPESNFVMQAAVLSRAQAFVGTYGGVAQWALRYARPSLSFYTSFNGTASAHLALSQRISQRSNVPFEVCDLRALALWQSALKHVTGFGRTASSGGLAAMPAAAESVPA